MIIQSWRYKWRYLNDGDASGGGGSADPGTYDSIDAAVAELDRRDAEREQSNQEAEDERPETDESDSGGQPEQEESAEVATEDEPAAETEEAPEKITFDGQELEIPKGTPKALVERLQSMAGDLKADYTRKTQEVAQERQQVRAVYQHTQQIQAQMQQVQQALVQFHEQEIGNPPDPMLIHTDAQSYLLQREIHAQKVQRLQQLMAHGQQLTQQQAEQQKYAMSQHLEQANANLLKQMPELADPAKRQAFSQRAVEVGSKYGISAAEVAAFTDPRMVLMLRDLDRFHAREASAGNVRQKLANVPPKVQKPGASAPDQGAGQRARNAKGEFMKSGRTLADVKRWAYTS